MKRLGRIIRRLVLALLGLVLILLSPVAYTEVACRGPQTASDYISPLAPEHFRNEARTLLTYPEWAIVHAYDDFAKVTSDQPPHAYNYFASIRGFWSALCPLSQQAGQHGGFDGSTKVMIYTIGVSFTAELAAKAIYEETIGRLAFALGGRGQVDDLAARQARSYADFLQQVPWYRWDFAADRQVIRNVEPSGFRDRERRIALGTEAYVKSRYAALIAASVAQMEPDALTLRMVISDIDVSVLDAHPDIKVIGPSGDGFEIETPRYRALTHLLIALAQTGANFTDIAGNDDIMLTATAAGAVETALFSAPRQGYGDTRSLIFIKVADLADTLRDPDITVEHIHDY